MLRGVWWELFEFKNMNNEIPITIEFDNVMPPSGYARVTDEVKKIFEDMYANGLKLTYVLAPAFRVKEYNEDGTIKEAELIELSLVPAERVIKK